jgi:hypothetical protein
MQLVSILACGVNGAESGTAEIYVRGTSTRATYYTGYDGSGSVASGIDVALDSNGGATVYVNQSVDVVVKNPDGSQVRAFTEMVGSPIVEYSGQSFTGTDYTTGALATSNPITLQQILDLWYTSSGAADFNTLLGGSAVTIQAALGTVYGFFYNVKSTAYGAEGDGTTDDTTAITSAITAAGVSGGIVFFPAGVYRITSSLTLPANVSLLGLGAENTFITMDHANNDLLVLDGGSNGSFQYVQGIDFSAAQSFSGYLLYGDTEETFITFRDCSFGGGNTTDTIIYADIDHAILNFRSCYFYPGELANLSSAITLTSAGTAWDSMLSSFDGCKFEFAAGQTGSGINMLKTCNSSVVSCRFDGSKMTNAISAHFIYKSGNWSATYDTGVSLLNNYFIGNGVATVNAIRNHTLNRFLIHESHNTFSSDISSIYNEDDQRKGSLGSRSYRYYTYGTDNSATIDLSLDYAHYNITRSDATALVVSADKATPGSLLVLCVENSNGGAATGNITFNPANFAEDIGPFTVAASSTRIATFIFSYDDGGNIGKWVVTNLTSDL